MKNLKKSKKKFHKKTHLCGNFKRDLNNGMQKWLKKCKNLEKLEKENNGSKTKSGEVDQSIKPSEDDHSIVYLEPKSSTQLNKELNNIECNKIKFFVKSCNGLTYPIEIEKTAYVKDLKEKIFAKDNIPTGEQRFILNGKELKDEDTIESYSEIIREGVTINTVLRLKGGGKETFEEVRKKFKELFELDSYGNGLLYSQIKNEINLTESEEKILKHLLSYFPSSNSKKKIYKEISIEENNFESEIASILNDFEKPNKNENSTHLSIDFISLYVFFHPKVNSNIQLDFLVPFLIKYFEKEFERYPIKNNILSHPFLYKAKLKKFERFKFSGELKKISNLYAECYYKNHLQRDAFQTTENEQTKENKDMNLKVNSVEKQTVKENNETNSEQELLDMNLKVNSVEKEIVKENNETNCEQELVDMDFADDQVLIDQPTENELKVQKQMINQFEEPSLKLNFEENIKHFLISCHEYFYSGTKKLNKHNSKLDIDNLVFEKYAIFYGDKNFFNFISQLKEEPSNIKCCEIKSPSKLSTNDSLNTISCKSESPPQLTKKQNTNKLILDSNVPSKKSGEKETEQTKINGTCAKCCEEIKQLVSLGLFTIVNNTDNYIYDCILTPLAYRILQQIHLNSHNELNSFRVCPCVKIPIKESKLDLNSVDICGRVYRESTDLNRSLFQHTKSDTHNIEIPKEWKNQYNELKAKDKESIKKLFQKQKLNNSNQEEVNKLKRYYFEQLSTKVSLRQLLEIEANAKNSTEKYTIAELRDNIGKVVAKWLFETVLSTTKTKVFVKMDKLLAKIYLDIEKVDESLVSEPKEQNNLSDEIVFCENSQPKVDINQNMLYYYLFVLNKKESHFRKSFYRDLLKNSPKWSEYYSVDCSKFESFLNTNFFNDEKNCLEEDNEKYANLYLFYYLKSLLATIICNYYVNSKDTLIGNNQKIEQIEKVKKYLQSGVVDKNVDYDPILKQLQSKFSEVEEFCKHFLIQKGIKKVEEASNEQINQFKLSISSPYPIIIAMLLFEKSKSLENDEIISKKWKKEDGKLKENIPQMFRILLENKFKNKLNFPISGSFNVIGNKISGSQNSKLPTLKKQNRFFPSYQKMKEYNNETFEKEKNTYLWEKVIITKGIELHICDFSTVLLKKITQIMEKNSIKVIPETLDWFFCISIDGSPAKTRYIIQTLCTISPKNTKTITFKLNDKNKSLFLTPSMLTFANLKENKENMRLIFPKILEKLKHLENKTYTTLFEGRTLKHTFSLALLKVDKKVAHMVINSVGPKGEFPSVNYLVPKKYLSILGKNHKDYSCFSFPMRTPENQKKLHDCAKEKKTEEFSSFSTFGEQNFNTKITSDYLHLGSNHQKQVLELIFAYLAPSLRENFSKKIKQICGIDPTETFPSKSSEVRFVIASISMILKNKSENKTFFENKRMGDLIYNTTHHLASLNKTNYLGSTADSDDLITRAIVLCFLSNMYLEKLIDEFPDVQQFQRKTKERKQNKNKKNKKKSDFQINFSTSPEDNKQKRERKSSQKEDFKYYLSDESNLSEDNYSDSSFACDDEEESEDLDSEEPKETLKTQKKVPKKKTDKKTEKKKRSSRDFVGKSYHFDLLVQFFGQFRCCDFPDFNNERDEQSWRKLKENIESIPKNLIFKFNLVKNNYRSRRRTIINNMYKSLFNFYEDLGDDLFIPEEFIKVDNHFHPYFSYFSAFLIDANPKNFTYADKCGLKITCPIERNGFIEEMMVKLTPEIKEFEMHKLIQEKAEQNFNNSEFSFDNFIIKKAFEEGKKECDPTNNKIMWWITVKEKWWPTNELFIECTNNLGKLDNLIKFYNSNNFIVKAQDQESIKKTRNNKEQRLDQKRKIVKDVLTNKKNQKKLTFFFPPIFETNKKETKENLNFPKKQKISLDLPTSNKKRKAESNPIANPKKKTKNKEKSTKNIESSSISTTIITRNEFKIDNEVEKEISNIFKCKDQDLVSKSKDQRILIKGEHIKRLKDKVWLNDEIINFYMNLLSESPKNLDQFFFSSFFYQQLCRFGFGKVQKWSKKIDIFSCSKIFIPIHLENHWCLAVIYPKEKIIKYYDPLEKSNNDCKKQLFYYLKEEHKDKKKKQLDLNGWNFEYPKNIPKQTNSYDCGVFLCQFAFFISNDLQLNFKEENMNFFRKKMVIEIVKNELLNFNKDHL